LTPPQDEGVGRRWRHALIRRSATLLAVLGLGAASAACSSRNVRGHVLEIRPDTTPLARSIAILGTQPVTLGEFEFHGTNAGLQSRWPPTSVQVTVAIRNTTNHVATLDFLGGNCAVRLRVYRAEDVTRATKERTPVRPVFDATQPGYECYVPGMHQRLYPGDTMRLQSAGDGPGTVLRPGRYEVTGVVTVVPPPDTLHRFGPHLVEVPAGSFRVPLPYD